MISHDQLAKALARQGVLLHDRKVNALMLDLLPNPQSGLSCDGATVWGDRKSIDIVSGWLHNSGNLQSLTLSWRQQVDSLQQRAIRAEELGIQMLAFIASVANRNPASAGVAPSLATQFLEDRGIQPHEGFFHTQDDAIADARTKFYASAHPKRG